MAESGDASKEETTHGRERHNALSHVYGYRIEPYDLEEPGSSFPSLHVDDIEEKCEQSERDASDDKYETAGPQFLVDRENDTP